MKPRGSSPRPAAASFALFCALAFLASGGDRAAAQAARLPVREATVFKDGLGLVTVEGALPVLPDGTVSYDAVPKAVLGAFWPTAAAGGPALAGAAVGRRRVVVERTALDTRELVEANLGADVVLTEAGLPPYHATLLSIPTRDSEELRRTSPPDAAEALAQKAGCVLVRRSDGVKVVPFDRLTDVVFKSPPKTTVATEERRDAVTWRLDWGGRAPTPTAVVGLSYVQRGLRWQPSYRVEIDGDGGADLVLTAVLVNDLADFEDVTVNFVVGSPRLDFADQLDAVVLDEAVRQVAAQAARQYDYGSNRLANFSNAISQVVAQGPDVEPAAAPAFGADGAGRSEDLYVFTRKGVTLARGGRLALRLAAWRLKYADVYKLSVPITPPRELSRQCDASRRAELAKLLALPKALHCLRVTNDGAHPLTTGPAAIFKAGRLLGQGLLTYTAVGASTDLPMSVAVDVRVARDDRRAEPQPNATKVGNEFYARVDVEGSVTITNFTGRRIELEVARDVLGALDVVEGGESKRLEAGDSELDLPAAPVAWWGWFPWPYWWHEMNGVGRASWKVALEPGKGATLKATWHYFWR